jgi:hypothetical protein
MPSSVERTETRSDLTLRGEFDECEICRERRRCFERFDLVVCPDCEGDLLPDRSLL